MTIEDFKFDETKIKNEFLETSEFQTLFPRHRIEYFKSVEEFIKKACELKKLDFEIDYEKCLMKVKTKKQTRDPYIIIKGNELIQLLSKGVLLENAVRILEDGVISEIIPIKMIVSNEKTFERRRKRLLNPKILNSLQLITKCHILIANKNACVIGDYRGVNDAKKIIIKCFENVHPAFQLKELIIKRKLIKDNVEGDWDRFLPKIKKTHSKNKTKGRIGGEMPEEIRDRVEDKEMETGEYFIKSKNLDKIKSREERKRKRDEIRSLKESRYIEPDE